MRGLNHYTVAGLLSIARASALVLQPQEAVGQLGNNRPLDLTLDQAGPIHHNAPDSDTAEATKPIVHDANRRQGDNQDEEQEDPVLAWLNAVEPSAPTGTLSGPFSFPSMTVSSIIISAIHTAPAPLTSERSLPTFSSHINTPPSPTPLEWHPWANAQQQPIGISEAWKQAKLKAQSVVSVIASHITSCPQATHLPALEFGTNPAISSTISARTVGATPTLLADIGEAPVGSAVNDVYSSVLTTEPSALPVIDPDVENDLDTSGDALPHTLLPLNTHVQPSPAHFTASSGDALPTSTSQPSQAQGQGTAASNGVSPDQVSGTGNYSSPVASDHPLSADPRNIAAIVIPTVLTITLACVIFAFLIRRNPRARAERAARLEERKNQRLYRKAACQYRFRTWRQEIASRPPFRWFAKTPTEDLAEKGLLASKPYDANGNRVSSEIQSFREAHDFVNTIVHTGGSSWASHDRRRTAMWLFGGRARRQRALSNASSDLSDSEKTAPPPYDERSLDEKIEVSVLIHSREDAQDSDKSSVSSIIPTSARNSTYTFSVDDPDSDKE